MHTAAATASVDDESIGSGSRSWSRCVLVSQVNAAPSLTANTPEDYQLKFQMLDEMYDLIDLEHKYVWLPFLYALVSYTRWCSSDHTCRHQHGQATIPTATSSLTRPGDSGGSLIITVRCVGRRSAIVVRYAMHIAYAYCIQLRWPAASRPPRRVRLRLPRHSGGQVPDVEHSVVRLSRSRRGFGCGGLWPAVQSPLPSCPPPRPPPGLGLSGLPETSLANVCTQPPVSHSLSHSLTHRYVTQLAIAT
jgi:hypothetical protein